MDTTTKLVQIHFECALGAALHGYILGAHSCMLVCMQDFQKINPKLLERKLPQTTSEVCKVTQISSGTTPITAP